MRVRQYDRRWSSKRRWHWRYGTTHHSDQPLPCCVKKNLQAYIGRAFSSVATVQVWLSSWRWGEGSAVADGEEKNTPCRSRAGASSVTESPAGRGSVSTRVVDGGDSAAPASRSILQRISKKIKFHVWVVWQTRVPASESPAFVKQPAAARKIASRAACVGRQTARDPGFSDQLQLWGLAQARSHFRVMPLGINITPL